MAQNWSLWLIILGVIFLIVGIAVAIWSSVNNKSYWYWGAIIGGLGVLFLLIAFILYIYYKTPNTCEMSVPVASPTRTVVYKQPEISSCNNPCQVEPQQSCPMYQHVFQAAPAAPVAAPLAPIGTNIVTYHDNINGNIYPPLHSQMNQIPALNIPINPSVAYAAPKLN